MPLLRTTGVATAILILPFPGLAQAAIWHSSVAVPMSVEYDSNPQLMTSGEKGATSTSIAPEYDLVGTYGRDQLHLGLGVTVLRSSDTSVVSDREDPDLALGWERETERGRYGFTGRYVENSTLSSVVQQTGVVTTDGTQKLYSLGGNWSTALTERNTLSNETEYRNVRYDISTLTDYDELSTRFDWTYAWNERTDLFTRFSAKRYEPDDSLDGNDASTNDYSPSVGVKYQFSERLQGGLRAGVNRLSGAEGGTSGEGGLELHYQGERLDASIAADRSSVASGEGGYAEVDQVQGAWSYAVDERSQLGMDASWQDSKGSTPNTLRKVGAWASRELSPFLLVRLSLVYQERQQDGLPDATGKVLGLSLTYRFPDF